MPAQLLLFLSFQACNPESKIETESEPSAPEAEERPEIPDGLVNYITGNPEDAKLEPNTPQLLLMGGGADVDSALEVWLENVSGGDVVVIRTSGSDGYNDYFFEELGVTLDSVETLLIDSRELADSDYVSYTLRHAEAIFIAGGDQATYIEYWKDTKVEAALATIGSLGGTSAGLAILGEIVFSAENGSVYSEEMLENPYNQYAQFETDFLSFFDLIGVITDSHFQERDRMGRLIGFMARSVIDGWVTPVLGLGIDEETAMLIQGGIGTVYGDGQVFTLKHSSPPETCEPSAPLEWSSILRYRLEAGDRFTFSEWETEVEPVELSIQNGALSENPYQ